MEKIDYGNKIVLIAQALGTNPSGLAMKLDVPNATMQSYINKGVQPPITFYGKLLKLLPNLNSKWFFMNEGNIILEEETASLKRENELYRKLEIEREKVSRLENIPKSQDIMDVMKNFHKMMQSMENDISEVKKKLVESN